MIVDAYVHHPSQDVQLKLFHLLQDVWKGWSEEKQALLKGPLLSLLDSHNKEIRMPLIQFWDSILSKSLPDRLQVDKKRLSEYLLWEKSMDLIQKSLGFQELLSLSISVREQWRDSIQARWPQSASILLLELPKGVPSYEDAMFNTSLAECNFMDYSINTWQSSNSTDLFTMGLSSFHQDTLRSISQAEASPVRSKGYSPRGRLQVRDCIFIWVRVAMQTRCNLYLFVCPCRYLRTRSGQPWFLH